MRRASLAPVPLLVPALAFALGIWAGWEWKLSLWLLAGVSLIGIGHCILALRFRWKGFLVGLALGFVGLGALSLSLSQLKHHHRFSPTAQAVIVRYVEPLWSGKEAGGWIGELEGQIEAGEWHPARGRIVLWTDQAPLPGDRKLIGELPSPAPRSEEPLASARGDLIARGGLSYELWVDSTNHWALAHQASLSRWLAERRREVRARIENSGLAQSDAALLSALLLGDRSALDQVQWDRFRAGGAAHALAVSGLHTGIVYGMLLLLFGGGQRRKDVRSFLLPLLGLWAFALLAGGAPSVLRAAAMLSFFHLGMRLRRNASPVNIWAAAGLILLIFNPLALLQVGFQFSFLAILGILLLDPLATRLWNPTDKRPRYFWRLLVAGFSASLFILPVQALHFHTFQPYGPLGSLLTIPWLVVVVWGGMILLALGGTFLGDDLASLLGLVNRLHDGWLDFIGGLPGATVGLPGYSIPSTFLLLFVLLLAIAATTWPTVRWRWAWLGALVLFFGMRVVDMKALGHERLVVYKSVLEKPVEWQEGSRAVALGPLLPLRDGHVLRRERGRLHQALGIDQVTMDTTTWTPLPDGAGWTHGKVAVIRAPFREGLREPLPVDLLVLTHWKARPEELWATWQPRQIILSAELPPWVRREHTELAALHGARVHDVRRKGTFVHRF